MEVDTVNINAEVTIDTLNFRSGTSINLVTNTAENRITINTNLLAGSGVELTVDSSTYRISSSLFLDTNPNLGGTLDINGHGIIGTGDINISGEITSGTVNTNSLNAGQESSYIDLNDVLKINEGVHEVFSTIDGATGTVTHNSSSGYIFYHTNPAANFKANFTNVELTTSYALVFSLVIDQGASGYYPSGIQINSIDQTINWQNNTLPTASSNRKDVVSFSILNHNSNYIVLGQLVGF